jgi:acyl carrier protein
MNRITDREAISNKIRKLVTEACGNEVLINSLQTDDALFSGNTGLDSVDMVAVIVLTERSFGISMADEAGLPDIFHSIDSITNYIITRLPATHP